MPAFWDASVETAFYRPIGLAPVGGETPSPKWWRPLPSGSPGEGKLSAQFLEPAEE